MSFATTTPPGTASPWGTYFVEPTEHGLRFQVSVRDPRNTLVLTALIISTAALAFLACTGFWSFLWLLLQLLVLDGALYPFLAEIRLIWIEVRPDGLAVTPKIEKKRSKKSAEASGEKSSEHFFNRRGIINRELDFDQGLTFRYGIHDIRATPGFANEREFEVFEVHFEQAIARLWHQENLDL